MLGCGRIVGRGGKKWKMVWGCLLLELVRTGRIWKRVGWWGYGRIWWEKIRRLDGRDWLGEIGLGDIGGKMLGDWMGRIGWEDMGGDVRIV
jgi:hypothetical protein